MLKIYYDRLWETCHNIFKFLIFPFPHFSFSPPFFLKVVSFLFLVHLLSQPVHVVFIISFHSKIVDRTFVSRCRSFHKRCRHQPLPSMSVRAFFNDVVRRAVRHVICPHCHIGDSTTVLTGFPSFVHLVCTCLSDYGYTLE